MSATRERAGTSPGPESPANRSSTQRSALSSPPATADGPISLRPGEDEEREAALRRMKRWATSLLVLASVIFVPSGPTEMSLVGTPPAAVAGRGSVASQSAAPMTTLAPYRFCNSAAP